MEDKPVLRFNARSAVCWTLAASTVLAAAGFWPTYSISGTPGIHSMLAAGLIVAVVGSVAISLVGLSAAGGAGKLSLAFVFSGMAKALACAALGFVASLLFPLSLKPFLLWLVLFYFVVLIIQSIWFVKVLRRVGR